MTNKQNNSPMIYTVIILLIIIAVLAFFLINNTNNPTEETTTPKNNVVNNIGKELSITIVSDEKCIECQSIINQLKQVPTLSKTEFKIKNFSDEGISDMLAKNDLKFLPAVIFSNNNVDSELSKFLTKLDNGDYSLQVGAKFDPLAKRSDKGFLLIEKELIKKIKDDSYIKGNPDAKITWLEYSDLECPYCAKLHNSGTPEELASKYGEDLNIIFNHFPLGFHDNALPGAQILECLGETNGADSFYSLIKKSYSEKNSNKNFLIDEAIKLGANEDNIKKCLYDNKYESKIKNQQKIGANNFGITGTPGNVLINNETGEYEVISGAYPTKNFEDIIDKLLAK